MSLGLRQLSMVGAEVVYPFAMWVSVTGTGPLARVARIPLTYSCRVRRPAGTGADQAAPLPLFQPVMRVPPLITGRAPGAAVQMIRWPPLAESRASSVNGWVSW